MDMIEPVAKIVGDKYACKLMELAEYLKEHDLWSLAAGPYPVSHGEKHIIRVMERVGLLLETIGDRFPTSPECPRLAAVYELAAATLIHDVAMGAVSLLTRDGDAKQRECHASIERLEAYLEDHDVGAHIIDKHRYHVTLIAWAHAADEEYSAEEKQEWLHQTFSGKSDSLHLSLCMRLLRFADLLDVGPARLNPLPESISLRSDQRVHRDKHLLVRVVVGTSRVEVNQAKPRPGVSPHATQQVVATIRSLCSTLRKQLDELPELTGWIVLDNLDIENWVVSPFY